MTINELLTYFSLAGSFLAIIATIFNIMTSKAEIRARDKAMSEDHDNQVREAERQKIKMETLEESANKAHDKIRVIETRETERDRKQDRLEQTMGYIKQGVDQINTKLDEHLRDHKKNEQRP